MPDSIANLLTDIRQMQAQILYFENRILRKRIAIEEIFHGLECRAEAAEVDAIAPLTVAQMMASVLPETDGVFQPCDLVARAQTKYPQDERKIREGHYHAVKVLLAAGAVTKVPGGFTK